MEQTLFAILALLGSSLTAAYVTNSWQKRRYMADALDSCSSGIFEAHGLIRNHLGRAYAVLHVQGELGGVTEGQKEQIDRAVHSGFEALGDLNREMLRLVSLFPQLKSELDQIRENVVSAGAPVTSLYYSPSTNKNSATPIEVKIPKITIPQALTALEDGQKQLFKDAAAFAATINITRSDILRDTWKIKPRFWAIGLLLLLSMGLASYWFGSSKIFVTGDRIFLYNRISKELKVLSPPELERFERETENPADLTVVPIVAEEPRHTENAAQDVELGEKESAIPCRGDSLVGTEVR